MKYFLISIFFGAVLNLFVLFPLAGSEIYPQWTGSMKLLDSVERSGSYKKDTSFLIADNNNLYKLASDGSLLKKINFSDKLFSYSENGKFYITYQQAGKNIDFWNFSGDRFWQLKSREYPYFSPTGNFVLLLNGDQSNVRIVDYNGNEIGVKNITGRLCTVITFATNSDFAVIGFLDGSYYCINGTGDIFYKGQTPENTIVKSVGINNSGTYVGVHYGNPQKDAVRLTCIKKKDNRDMPLDYVHSMRTALHVDNDGNLVIFDHTAVKYFDNELEPVYMLPLKDKKEGSAYIDCQSGIYGATYSTNRQESVFLLFKKNGTVLFRQLFTSDTFIRPYIKNGLIFLRGSDNVFCYSLHGQDDPQ